jgi:hypothetical protein
VARYNRTVARYREARSLELATAGGSWDAIAKELGYADRSGAWKAAHRALDRRVAEAVDTHRYVMVAELEHAQERAWPAAMRGDVRAGHIVLKAMDRKDRLLGLSLSVRREDEAERLRLRVEAAAALEAVRRAADDALGPFGDLGC